MAAEPIWLVGELDMHTCASLLRDLLKVLRDRPAGLVVLDVSRVSFVDVAGVRQLLEVRTRVAAAGQDLVLRSPSPCLRYLLALTGLEDAFTSAPSAAELAGDELAIDVPRRRRSDRYATIVPYVNGD
jgi:anti-sigma B factor antagonist